DNDSPGSGLRVTALTGRRANCSNGLAHLGMVDTNPVDYTAGRKSVDWRTLLANRPNIIAAATILTGLSRLWENHGIGELRCRTPAQSAAGNDPHSGCNPPRERRLPAHRRHHPSRHGDDGATARRRQFELLRARQELPDHRARAHVS